MYVGSQSPFLTGKVGTVLSKSPKGEVSLQVILHGSCTIPVEWEDGIGYFGVYGSNLKLVQLEAQWEV
jgi:hypothetical protein